MRLATFMLKQARARDVLRLGYFLGRPYRFGLAWRDYVAAVRAAANMGATPD